MYFWHNYSVISNEGTRLGSKNVRKSVCGTLKKELYIRQNWFTLVSNFLTWCLVSIWQFNRNQGSGSQDPKQTCPLHNNSCTTSLVSQWQGIGDVCFLQLNSIVIAANTKTSTDHPSSYLFPPTLREGRGVSRSLSPPSLAEGRLTFWKKVPVHYRGHRGIYNYSHTHT